MKVSFAIAAIVAYAAAQLPEDELDAFDQSVDTAPPGMGRFTPRKSEIKIGRALGRNARGLCLDKVKEFNRYCMGKDEGAGKFRDYRKNG